MPYLAFIPFSNISSRGLPMYKVYARVNGVGAVIEYPLTAQQLVNRVHREDGYKLVQVQEKPSYNRLWQRLAPTDVYIENGIYKQDWLVVSQERDSLVRTKFEYLVAYRFAKEVGGTTLPTGEAIDTDRDSRVGYRQLEDDIAQGYISATEWKMSGDNWVLLDTPTLQTMRVRITDHVKACFAAEKLTKDQLLTMSDSELGQCDPAAIFETIFSNITG